MVELHNSKIEKELIDYLKTKTTEEIQYTGCTFEKDKNNFISYQLIDTRTLEEDQKKHI